MPSPDSAPGTAPRCLRSQLPGARELWDLTTARGTHPTEQTLRRHSSGCVTLGTSQMLIQNQRFLLKIAVIFFFFFFWIPQGPRLSDQSQRAKQLLHTVDEQSRAGAPTAPAQAELTLSASPRPSTLCKPCPSHRNPQSGGFTHLCPRTSPEGFPCLLHSLSPF